MWKMLIKKNFPTDMILDCYMLEQDLPTHDVLDNFNKSYKETDLPANIILDCYEQSVYKNTENLLEEFIESGKQLKLENKVIKILSKFKKSLSL